jgi:hypothetical protein
MESGVYYGLLGNYSTVNEVDYILKKRIRRKVPFVSYNSTFFGNIMRAGGLEIEVPFLKNRRTVGISFKGIWKVLKNH